MTVHEKKIWIVHEPLINYGIYHASVIRELFSSWTVINGDSKTILELDDSWTAICFSYTILKFFFMKVHELFMNNSWVFHRGY